MRFLYPIFITLLLFNKSIGQKADSLNVYFETGQSNLSIQAKHSIDSLLYHDVLIVSNKVQVVGYADNTGRDATNIHLSSLRAKSVAEYLMYMGIDKQNIELIIGKGAVKRNYIQESNYKDRCVTIIIENVHQKVKLDTNINKILTLNKGEKIELNNIVFESGTAIILPESYPTLLALTDVLKENPKIKIRIEGHVCCYNDLLSSKYPSKREIEDAKKYEEYGYRISNERAMFIRNYLLSKGIARYRLSYKALGASVPLYETDGKTILPHKNRRVEIRIMDK